MNGVALGVAAGTIMSPLEAAGPMGAEMGSGTGYYPPELTGMRGNHAGAFEIAHGVAREGKTWPRPAAQTDDNYDLVVVGGGISGLSAAFLYRQRTGPDAKILVLDNHDDFGGHAKRNEFDVDGHKLIGYGGSQSLEGPASYSPAAKKLLQDISIDPQDFYTHFDQKFHKRWNLENAIYFNQQSYGVDRILPDPFSTTYLKASRTPAKEIINKFPVRKETREALIRLVTNDTDYLPGLKPGEKAESLRKISYVDFLQQHAGIPKEGADLLRDKFKSYWGTAWDALSALEGARLGMPGTAALGLTDQQLGWDKTEEPYIFHFPDGNAGIARSLVRRLIPEAVPGKTMQDLVTSRVDYAALDREGSNVRIRLNSTGVDVRHTDVRHTKDGKAVDVTYVQNGVAHRVRGKHTILACYNNIIPHICPELPKVQRDAMAYATKVPLVYINIAIRNWRAFANLGLNRIFIPQAELMYSMEPDFPVSMGNYKFSKDPDKPIVVHGTVIPTVPGRDLSGREQHILGRQRIYGLSFADFEEDVYQQMDGALSGGGFDAGRDIAAITVNRWPHGYAYEYNELWDPVDWTPKNGPHVTGRAQIGRISIANSDASAYAYVDGAIDAAVRAVDEQAALD